MGIVVFFLNAVPFNYSLYFLQVSKHRPRFKETLTLSDDEGAPGGAYAAAAGAGGHRPARAAAGESVAGKKMRRAAKPSFLTGRGIVSASRFLNYHFSSLQPTGKTPQFPIDLIHIARVYIPSL